MDDRETELEDLVAELRGHDAVVDALLAKSFTDRLVIVDSTAGGSLPTALRDRLAAHDLEPASAVYGDGAASHAFVGDVGDADRHHYVDVRTRGSHRSYVVD